jgi:hypothetical protein
VTASGEIRWPSMGRFSWPPSHRYKKAARELWKFCADMTGGVSASFIARTLEEMQERGETIDWWERGNPESRRH